MMIRTGTFDESYLLLKKLWPDSHHIRNFDNSVGLVEWQPTEYYKIVPKFYVIENQHTNVVATVHGYLASRSTICIRGLHYEDTVSIDLLKKLIVTLINEIKTNESKKAYLVHKENLNRLLDQLGFDLTTGPIWTNDWKVYISWIFNIAQLQPPGQTQ